MEKNGLKDKLQNQATKSNNQAKGLTLYDDLKKMENQFKMVIPKHMDAEKFLRVALTEVRINPKLNECSKASVLGAFMSAATLGLEPGMLGQCYLLPFQSKRGMECQFLIGYKGMIDLARRSGNIESFYAQVVKENDTFEYEYGLNPTLSHKPSLTNRGKTIGAYAVAKFKDGGYQFEFLSVEDIEKRRARSKAANSQYSPWATDYDEMAMKTVVRHMFKYLPISIEQLKNVATDESVLETKAAIDKKDKYDIDEVVEITPTDYVDADFTPDTMTDIPEELK